MRLPLPALEAFAADTRNTGLPADALHDQARSWLTIATAAEALGSLRGRKRKEFLSQLEESLLPPTNQRPTLVHDVAPSPETQLGSVTERIRVAAEAMEKGGYLNLAYTTVSALCRLIVREDRPLRLMTTIHLGRIARELSDFPTAVDCYKSVIAEGLRERDGPATGRGFIGLAMIAVMRGNFPLVREYFERALSHTPPNSETAVNAHMGLANVARRQKDFAKALRHGWQAHDLTQDDELRVGLLASIATTALQSGYARAAMKGFSHVLSIATSPLVRLSTLQDAMLAAAALGDEKQLDAFEQTSMSTASAFNQPFEVARLKMTAADAWNTLGNRDRSRALALEAIRVAEHHGYHELSVRADVLLHELSRPMASSKLPIPTVPEKLEHTQADEFSRDIHRLESLHV